LNIVAITVNLELSRASTRIWKIPLDESRFLSTTKQVSRDSRVETPAAFALSHVTGWFVFAV